MKLTEEDFFNFFSSNIIRIPYYFRICTIYPVQFDVVAPVQFDVLAPVLFDVVAPVLCDVTSS